MPFGFSDNFNDNSLDTTNRWTKVDAGTNVTESSGKLNIQGSNVWNANGVYSKISSGAYASQIRLQFDVTTPASDTLNNNFMGGFSQKGTGLSYSANNEFQVYLVAPGSDGFHIYYLNGATNADTGYKLTTSTTYSFRITVTHYNTITVRIDVKGGTYTNWTTVFSSLSFSNTDNASQYIQFQTFSSAVVFSVDNVEFWEVGAHLSLGDNFNLGSLDTNIWSASTNGVGSVTVTNNQLQIKGNNTAWNTNGVVTKNFVVGFYCQAMLDVTIPSLSDANGILFGWSRSSTLNYNGPRTFQVYINPTHAPYNVRIITDSAVVSETTINVAANTVYTFRMTWDYTGTNPSILAEIKGGAFSTWTQVYQNASFTDYWLWNQYFQIQTYSSAYTYIIDNFYIYEKTYDCDVASIGNSLDLGTGGTAGEFMKRFLALTGKTVAVYAIAGQTTSNILDRFKGDAVYRMGVSVLIEGGTNDYYYSPEITIDQTLSNLDSMLSLFNAGPVGSSGETRSVYLCEPPPVSNRGSIPSGLTNDQMRERTKKLYSEYRKWCVTNSVLLAPTYQEIANTGTNAISGVITTTTVTNGGSAYPASGNVSFTGGGGTGAAGTYTATGGVIQSVVMTNEGSGYTGNATAVFDGGGTNGAGTGNCTIDDAIPQSYVYLGDGVGVHLIDAGYDRMGDMISVSSVPLLEYRWGNPAYPSVNDESWKWWIWSAGSPTITNNADTGELNLPQNASADSDVKCLARGGTKLYQVTISPTVTSGTVTAQYRFQTSNFNRNNGSPSWNNYAAPFNITGSDTNNTFLQIRFTGTSAVTAVISEANITWALFLGANVGLLNAESMRGGFVNA